MSQFDPLLNLKSGIESAHKECEIPWASELQGNDIKTPKHIRLEQRYEDSKALIQDLWRSVLAARIERPDTIGLFPSGLANLEKHTEVIRQMYGCSLFSALCLSLGQEMHELVSNEALRCSGHWCQQESPLNNAYNRLQIDCFHNHGPGRERGAIELLTGGSANALFRSWGFIGRIPELFNSTYQRMPSKDEFVQVVASIGNMMKYLATSQSDVFMGVMSGFHTSTLEGDSPFPDLQSLSLVRDGDKTMLSLRGATHHVEHCLTSQPQHRIRFGCPALTAKVGKIGSPDQTVTVVQDLLNWLQDVALKFAWPKI